MKSLAKLLLLVIMMAGCESCKEEDKYPPAVRTLEPEEITTTSALLRGEIVTLGTEAIIRKGFCWLPGIHANTPRFPTVIDNTIEVTENSNPFTFTLSELAPRSTYYVRAFVETSLGIVYGEIIDFITNYETVTDIDGNVYTIVKIGDQYWTRENLNVTRLRDGTPIPNWTEDSFWGSGAPKEPGMCWYNNDREQYEVPYGALYNWFAASHPLIAPEGWKVPHLSDYEKLDKTLGSHAGDRMKVTGNYWKESDNASGAKPNNDSDFSAYPAGWRDGEKFGGLSLSIVLWNSSSYVNSLFMADFAWIQYNSPHFYEAGIGSTNNGRSLRLLKDN